MFERLSCRLGCFVIPAEATGGEVERSVDWVGAEDENPVLKELSGLVSEVGEDESSFDFLRVLLLFGFPFGAFVVSVFGLLPIWKTPVSKALFPLAEDEGGAECFLVSCLTLFFFVSLRENFREDFVFFSCAVTWAGGGTESDEYDVDVTESIFGIESSEGGGG